MKAFEFVMIVLLTLVLVGIVCVVGCESKRPLAAVGTNNPDYEVKLLVEFDGCKVYYLDAGRGVYFMRCPNSVVRSEWDTRANKSTIHNQAETLDSDQIK